MVRDDRRVAGERNRTIKARAVSDWYTWWQRGGFDHVERHDDRVQLFATRLSEGRHEFCYIVRATTAGTFRTAPARAEEMYTPEVFGRTATRRLRYRTVAGAWLQPAPASRAVSTLRAPQRGTSSSRIAAASLLALVAIVAALWASSRPAARGSST